jgi:tetratricopeptide (TPR) repeat protein
LKVDPGQAQTAGVILLLTTLAAVIFFRRLKFFVTGWFWFVGMLVPVIGLVQVGSQAHADRYTYLPHLGLFLVIAWLLGVAANRSAGAKVVIGGASAGSIIILALLCNRQVQVWRDSTTLFAHAVNVNPNDYLSRSLFASEELKAGRLDSAIEQAKEVLKVAPEYPLAENVIGAAYQMRGQMAESIPHLLAIRDAPELSAWRNTRLALAYIHLGELASAESTLKEIEGLESAAGAVYLIRAAIARESGNAQLAAEMFRRMVSPALADNPTMNFQIAELYALIGEPKEAIPFYDKALEMQPAHVNALNNCAWLLATSSNDGVRNGAKAVQLAERACELSQWKVPVLIGTLAAAYAEAGRFGEAVKTAEKARDLAREQGMEDVAKRNEELLGLYREGKPVRD